MRNYAGAVAQPPVNCIVSNNCVGSLTYNIHRSARVWPKDWSARGDFANAVTEQSLSPSVLVDMEGATTVSCMQLVVVAGPLLCACTFTNGPH